MKASEHSTHAPSSASRRWQCARSRLFEAQYPDQETEASREGDAAHWLACLYAGNHMGPGGCWRGKPIDQTYPTHAPNGVGLTPEMWDGAQMWADYLGGLNCVQACLETRIEIPGIHPDCWGTTDFRGIDAAGIYHIADYKFGHRPVPVFKNAQLLEYGHGFISADYAARHAAGKPFDPANTFIRFHIVQPRSYHKTSIRGGGPCDMWEVSVARAGEYWAELIKMEQASDDPNAPYGLGPECRDCKARHDCPALLAANLTECQLVQEGPPLHMSLQATATALRFMTEAKVLLDAQISALSAVVEAEIEKGVQVPGWAIGRTNGRTVWKKPVEEVIALGKIFNVDLAKPVEPITPTQAKQKGIDGAVISLYSESTGGSKKLIPDDLSTYQRIFEK